MNIHQEKPKRLDDSYEKKIFDNYRNLGFTRGEAMKAVNKQGQIHQEAGKTFRDNFEKEHGCKPID